MHGWKTHNSEQFAGEEAGFRFEYCEQQDGQHPDAPRRRWITVSREPATRHICQVEYRDEVMEETGSDRLFDWNIIKSGHYTLGMTRHLHDLFKARTKLQVLQILTAFLNAGWTVYPV